MTNMTMYSIIVLFHNEEENVTALHRVVAGRYPRKIELTLSVRHSFEVDWPDRYNLRAGYTQSIAIWTRNRYSNHRASRGAGFLRLCVAKSRRDHDEQENDASMSPDFFAAMSNRSFASLLTQLTIFRYDSQLGYRHC